MAEKVDVLVIGGGPVGCLLAAQLHRFKTSAIVVEKEDKPSLPIYGRACTLWCRTLEMLDQLDLCEPLFEQGCCTKNGYNFRNGLSAPGGISFGQRMDKHGDTRFGFALHLRQRLIERAFEDVLGEYGAYPRHRTELVSFTVDEASEYPVISIVRDTAKGEEYEIHSKYIVGCDGAHSVVRRTAGIVFQGERTANKWIRMDATVTTNMPSPRTLNSVQSDTHGLVLWCPIDEGKIRIGYVWSRDLIDKYGEDGATPENVIAEAKRAVAPFELEVIKLDWHTLYGIGQCMGEGFVKGRVILAGDAIHTHSSGSAQGLNTGGFDVMNLGWKLALHLQGKATRALLDSYSEERQGAIKQVIDNDKIISTLVSGQLPPKYKDRKEPTRLLLDEFFENQKNLTFTVGLGLSYPANSLVNVTPAQPPLACILPGERGPDATVFRLGTGEPVRLQRLMPNKGHFYLAIFAGNPQWTQPRLEALRRYFDNPAASTVVGRYGKGVVQTLTLFGVAGTGASDVMSGLRPFGRSYYDAKQDAHEIYGIDPHAGALLVFRPDGYIGRVVALDQPQALQEYFDRFLIPAESQTKTKTVSNGH